mmetsp:Transcript_75451/g.245420  ORF Transcript_75451/g.245420 Transcript_75451/m.245420 type:complete len:326 (-) Transcript_75451:567-1544(-)
MRSCGSAAPSAWATSPSTSTPRPELGAPGTTAAPAPRSSSTTGPRRRRHHCRGPTSTSASPRRGRRGARGRGSGAGGRRATRALTASIASSYRPSAADHRAWDWEAGRTPRPCSPRRGSCRCGTVQRQASAKAPPSRAAQTPWASSWRTAARGPKWSAAGTGGAARRRQVRRRGSIRPTCPCLGRRTAACPPWKAPCPGRTRGRESGRLAPATRPIPSCRRRCRRRLRPPCSTGQKKASIHGAWAAACAGEAHPLRPPPPAPPASAAATRRSEAEGWQSLRQRQPQGPPPVQAAPMSRDRGSEIAKPRIWRSKRLRPGSTGELRR